MQEKLKEKFEISINDELISLNIYSAQLKFPEFKEKYLMLIEEENKDEEFILNQ